MHSKEIEKYKQKLSLTQEQRDILVGLLLGDAHLETQNGGRTYRLKIEYSLKNKAYGEHIYEIFKEWILSSPRIKQKKSNDSLSENIAFSTVSHASLRFYAQQFYKDSRKVVPRIINRLLTSKGLAYWFMDDGSIKSNQSKGVIFNTQGFIRQDVSRLVEVLSDKFGLNVKERKQKDGYQIYISGHSFEDFRSLVCEYIHPSMDYKLPKARRT